MPGVAELVLEIAVFGNLIHLFFFYKKQLIRKLRFKMSKAKKFLKKIGRLKELKKLLSLN